MLCGNNGEACWSKYGSYPLHRPYCHEMALRILLASLEAHANRHKRYIVPVSPPKPSMDNQPVSKASVYPSRLSHLLVGCKKLHLHTACVDAADLRPV